MMKRYFLPGSEWVYFKLYTGAKTADELLVSHIGPLLDQMLDKKQIDKWFFIRYSDPNFHLRLRLLVLDGEQYGSVMKQLHEVLDKCYVNHMLHSVICDTYARELERYGEETMELCEDIFSVDSHYIVKLLDVLSTNDIMTGDEQFRWELALLLNDDLFDAFGYDVFQRSEIIASFADNYKREFNLTSNAFTKQINDKYRKLRPNIDKAYARENARCETIYQLLEDRKNKQAKLRASDNFFDKHDQETQQKILTSLLHMTMNRLFRSKNRMYELVIYDFMQRYYKSIIARNKQVK